MEALQTTATPETVWAILQRVGEKQEETARQIEELRKSQKKQEDEFNKRLGRYTNRFGEIIEHLIAPNLREKFRDLGFNFLSANSNTLVDDHENNIHFEIDVKLENGDKVMLIEIKTKPTTEDVQEHIERLEKMRKYADLHGDKRKFLGAVAGVVMTTNVKEYALKQGFFAIEPSGETFYITPPKNQPKEW